MPFFKISDADELLQSAGVYAPNYTLDAAQHDSYTYPVDGWYWFGTLADAMRGLSALPKNGVPQQVSFRQAKQELIVRGWWSQILTAVDAIADPVQRELMRTEVLDSQVYERQRPALITMAKGVLHLTDEQIDALFVEASKR